jgi:hypothetical protein
MTTDEPRRTHGDRSQRPPEFEAVLKDLNACVQRIHMLIPRVHAVIDQRVAAVRPHARPRVVNFGGPSVFRFQGPSAPERKDADASHSLIVAADLALAGYSSDQISARLQASGDPAAALALKDLYE